MSQHHHHDNKHHHAHDQSPRTSKPIHHDWRFYAAAALILIAMVLYLLSGDLSWRPAPPASQPAQSTSGN
jgi:hypothetical protein